MFSRIAVAAAILFVPLEAEARARGKRPPIVKKVRTPVAPKVRPPAPPAAEPPAQPPRQSTSFIMRQEPLDPEFVKGEVARFMVERQVLKAPDSDLMLVSQ